MEKSEIIFYVFGDQAIIECKPSDTLKELVKKALIKVKEKDILPENCTCKDSDVTKYAKELDINAKVQDLFTTNGQGEPVSLVGRAIYIRY
jgi:hypothetical protein